MPLNIYIETEQFLPDDCSIFENIGNFCLGDFLTSIIVVVFFFFLCVCVCVCVNKCYRVLVLLLSICRTVFSDLACA